jgi:hypothetical protein
MASQQLWVFQDLSNTLQAPRVSKHACGPCSHVETLSEQLSNLQVVMYHHSIQEHIVPVNDTHLLG